MLNNILLGRKCCKSQKSYTHNSVLSK